MSSFTLGWDSFSIKNHSPQEVNWNTDLLSNSHVGITGTSGAGKTHQIKRFLSHFSQVSQVQMDIFDYHGDIDIEGASVVTFSEQTKYGYNPFVVNLDPHYGGLRKATNSIIEIMSSNRKLGEQQSAVLRNLVMDCYAVKRIYPDNPKSWERRDAPEEECERLYNSRDWNGLSQCYPTLLDLERLIIRKLKLSLLGLDDNNQAKKSLFAFEGFLKAAKSLRLTKNKSQKENSDESQAALDKSRTKAVEEYSKALEAVEDGNEFDDLIKYNSAETLQSLLTRVQNVRALGLFNANPPPFTNHCRRYYIKPIASSPDELKMFIFSRLKAIYKEEMQRGESHGKVRRVILIDEAKRFCDDEAENPINVIANEARKFGISLILASQSPVHFSTDFINSAGTLLIQNMATGDYDMAARKLQIEKEKLTFLVPRKNGLVRLLEVGKPGRWKQIDYQK